MTTATLPSRRSGDTILVFFMATVVMLFAGFTAALLIRRAGTDWFQVSLPPLLLWNTLILVGSSVTLELARRIGRSPWLGITFLLGLGFLAGQFLAWQQLQEMGIFLPTHPHSAFFYILSALHGLHLLGGIGMLAFALRRNLNLRLSATYWHFLGLVWLYVLFLLNYV